MPRRSRPGPHDDDYGHLLAEVLGRPTLTERRFQDQIVELARDHYGWLVVHYGGNQHRRAYYDATGFPDLLMISRDGRIMFRELKTDRGVLTPDQERWGRELGDRGVDHAVWRPDDWPAIVADVSDGKASAS